MLKKYAEKRNFKKTSEPEPEVRDGEGPLRFCVQKHAATNLHYDLRLECDGVLKSWAVPKGPSLNPEHKHFAAMVEDHPLDYATFEGTIPDGEYGAGEVIVWDEGIYVPDEGVTDPNDRDSAQKAVRDGIAKGKLGITVLGKKLKGSFALVRMKKDTDWLLLKHKDKFASDTEDVLADDTSVRSKRRLGDFNRSQLKRQAAEAKKSSNKKTRT